MRRTSLALALALALAACREEVVETPAVDRNNPLDVAASEANLIVDPASTSPVGLFERAHSSGSDGLCVAPDGAGNLTFGLVMRFGPTLICEGSGAARHSGAVLTLRFANADCTVDAEYDGQSLRLPGSVPDGCVALCGERAAISGGAMNRVGWTVDDALRLRSARRPDATSTGQPLCRPVAAP